MQHDHPNGSSDSPDRSRTISRYVFFGFVAVAAFFLVAEHRAHLFGVLPFLLLAACPLMHLFHHGGHGGNQDEQQPGGANRNSSNEGSQHQH